MKTITIEYTDTQAKQIGYYLRKKYKVDKRARLSRLCELAITDETQAQAWRLNMSLYEINMRVYNQNIDFDAEHFDLEITLTADGGIEQILIDGREPENDEITVINDNLREIQYEIGFRWLENERNKHYELWAEV